METLLQDVRYGLRMLAKNPGFAVAAVLCLGLGIGATTAIFSVVNAVLLRPLPYVQSNRLLKIYSEFGSFPGGGLRRFWVSPPEFLDLRNETKSWASLDAWVNDGVNLTGATNPTRATASLISGSMLTTLGVAPAQGRLITPADDDPNSPGVADISYGLWQRVFGGRSDIIGQEVQLNGSKCTIVGVMPKGFAFPPGEVDPPDVWAPLQIDPAKPGDRGSHFLYLLGRLRPNVSAQQAQTELDSLVRYHGQTGSAKEHHFEPVSHTLVSYPLQSEVVGNVRPALLMLLGAVASVLLIACVNVANLLLARAESRQREIALRTAFGAAFRRLLQQFVTEGILLSLVGAILGIGLAYAGLYVIKATNAGGLPRAAEIGMDLRVLLFTLLVSVLTGIVFGLMPLTHLIVKDLQATMKDAAGATTATVGAQTFRKALVAGEMSLALILLVSCGLMLRAFWKLQKVDTGVKPDGVLTMRVTLPDAIYADNPKRDNFWYRLHDRIAHIPGIQSAALVTGLPPIRRPNVNDTDIEGFVPKKGGPIQSVDFYQTVSKGYFETMGIRLIEGRFFDDRDAKGGPDNVIINQTMAHMFWGNQSAIGRRIRPGGDPWCTIIGVVEDVKNAGIDKPTGTELYLPYRQTHGSGNSNFYVVVRSQREPQASLGEVRHELHDLDPSLPLSAVRTMDEVMSAAQSRPRFLSLLLSIFSGIALALAAIGIYGVLSYLVARRVKEFGLRMALGAERRHVLGLVLRQGAVVLLAGAGVGLIAALLLSRLMSGLLYGIGANDPWTFVTVTLTLTLVAFVASYIPARRATKADPMVALRCE